MGFSYSYDEAGNMTVGMGQSYAYDGANRMKTAGNGSSAYGYDGDGMRVRKTESGATVFYVRSSISKNVAVEVSGAGVQRSYVYHRGQIVAQLNSDGQFYWLHTNHLGSSRAMTDANGNLTYKGQFDPYGQVVSEWSSSGNTNLSTRKFTGYERDAATGMDYANARMYNSGRGRFMRPDPSGLKAAELEMPQSLNRYSYVRNDPVNLTDPSGLEAILCVYLISGFDYYQNGKYIGRTVENVQIACSSSLANRRDNAGGGSGGGGGQVVERKPLDREEKTRDDFRRFLNQEISSNCSEALAPYLDRIRDRSYTVNLIDVDKHENELAYLYYSTVPHPGATLGEWFDNKGHGGLGATTTTGDIPVPGIYFRGRNDSFSGDGMYLLLHEMMHVVVSGPGDLDQILADRLGISQRDGETYSDAVSRYFSSKCDPKEKK